MPIPFRDADDVEELGAAGFLKVERAGSGTLYLGGLFLINARGEPLEFVYNLVETPHTFLWRPADLRRHAHRELLVSLFSACVGTPSLLFCLADEVVREVVATDVELLIPVGRVEHAEQVEGAASPAAPSSAPVTSPSSGLTPSGPSAVAPPSEAVHVFWHPKPPAEGSPERRLFERLSAQGLLFEPFSRAAYGLREVYGAKDGVSRE
ncbi:MAG: hypothetical protein IT305_22015 [Chloroflexi bacterium]|nr:hypothetical protein [Chloroflexota bacterium]